MPPRRKGRTLSVVGSSRGDEADQSNSSSSSTSTELQAYLSPTKSTLDEEENSSTNSPNHISNNNNNNSHNNSPLTAITTRNTNNNNNLFVNNNLNNQQQQQQYQRSFMSSSPSANSLLFGANHHVIRPTNFTIHQQQQQQTTTNNDRTDSDHSESFLSRRTFSVDSFSDKGDNDAYLSPCSDEDDSNPSGWKSPLSAPVRVVDIASLIPEEIEYPEDDDVDVDPELLVIRSKLNTSDIHDSDAIDLVIENSKKKIPTKSPRSKIVDETPFFQAHIHYDDDDKQTNNIEKVTTTCCGCFLEKIPKGIRTRVGYCGKKVCAPRFSVSIGLFIAFNTVAFILAVFGIAVLGLSYGDYPKMQRDPNAIAYLHRGCCEVFLQEKHSTVDNGYPYDVYLRVPILGFSSMTEEQLEKRGYDIKSLVLHVLPSERERRTPQQNVQVVAVQFDYSCVVNKPKKGQVRTTTITSTGAFVNKCPREEPRPIHKYWQRRGSCHPAQHTLSPDVIHQISLFVNFFDGNKLKHVDTENEEEVEDDNENNSTPTFDEQFNLLNMMLIDSQWNQVLNSDEYYKDIISTFLSQDVAPHYFKVPGYGRKKLDDYEVLIMKGIYQSWKELFVNL
ncbi:predicted protein [Naegleria gruberi]|uniref:Predicted protein n=1 Tax=Naegleria gruberi TaxID=5762 RepID=D2VFA5_NAEGR|nr:uncharacterized protein NAEGRDRAFT_49069 [Naegleria gruberi]EFC44336.1 predicted protein [Naegleria gruberi]|eukprot:XP_002677080.1 predicted protein [Naegleria gruberi strain NEG-M]